MFINPVGTGYSAAIAPAKNKDFWGTDQDARSIDRFIQRYLTKYSRWNSPKFLYGESYGTARSAVVSWVLHEDGIDLNGITLQSSILDYANALSALAHASRRCGSCALMALLSFLKMPLGIMESRGHFLCPRGRRPGSRR